MKSIHEVIGQKEQELKQKEAAVQQLLKELDALRLAARLMAEDGAAAAVTAPAARMAQPPASYSAGWSASAAPKQFP